MGGRKWHSYFGQSKVREQDFKQNVRGVIAERIIEPLEFADVFPII